MPVIPSMRWDALYMVLISKRIHHHNFNYPPKGQFVKCCNVEFATSSLVKLAYYFVCTFTKENMVSLLKIAYGRNLRSGAFGWPLFHWVMYAIPHWYSKTYAYVYRIVCTILELALHSLQPESSPFAGTHPSKIPVRISEFFSFFSHLSIAFNRFVNLLSK